MSVEIRCIKQDDYYDLAIRNSRCFIIYRKQIEFDILNMFNITASIIVLECSNLCINKDIKFYKHY